MMDGSSITMEDYILNLTGKACWDDQIFDDWKFSIKGKMSKELSEGNIGCLRFFELKFPAIIYNDSLNYKERPSQDSCYKSNYKSELSFPITYYCKVMSEKKIFKKRFTKKEEFGILKDDKIVLSYKLLKFKNAKIHNKSCDYLDNILYEISSLVCILNSDELNFVFVFNHETNYYSLNKEIMTYIKSVVPIILVNPHIPYGIPFDTKFVYKEICCGGKGAFHI